MPNVVEFRPDWVSPPGDTIQDILRERKLSISDFAKKVGSTEAEAAALLRGSARVTIALARQLTQTLGASVEFWMSREFHYRQERLRANATEEDWIESLPIRDMVKFGWLGAIPKKTKEIAACLHFFDVPDLAAWRSRYSYLSQSAVFRTSPSFVSRPGALAVWLRQGEIEAKSIPCSPWNRDGFVESLSGIRGLTREKDPSKFIPILRKICSAHGVAVVALRAPTGCRASGATRFLLRDKALLLLSFRHLSDDQFWFTFFHEAGHLSLHGENSFFVEGATTVRSKEEDEADNFAEATLIPKTHIDALLSLPLNGREVMRFARMIGVSPGIVVGQLQHFKRIERYQLNNLKRRYTW